MSSIPFTVYDFFGYLAAGSIVLAATDFAFGAHHLQQESVPLIQGLLLIVLAYVIGHVIAHLASFLFESLLIRKVLKSPEDHMFAKDVASKWSVLFPSHFAPLPASTRDRVLAAASKEGIQSPGRDLFLHCHAAVRHDDPTQARLNTFLYLYGFSRNTSMAFLYSAILFLLASIRVMPMADNQPTAPFAVLSVTCLILFLIMLLRYLKFFRHYTQEVFLSYSEISLRKGASPSET